MVQINKDNHYIPQLYLKNWSSDGNTVWMYRRLVSHENVEWWKQQAINGIAFLPNLYSHTKDGNTTDEFENWLNHEIETPAKYSIEKVINGEKLADNEMLALLRFTAAQIVRTPAYYIKHHEGWIRDLPQVMTKAMESARDKIVAAISRRDPLPMKQDFELDELMPLKLSREPIVESDGTTYIKAETVVGRAMWLSHIKRMATTNVSILQKHQWHIIEAAPGIEWPTSDDPVICLAYRDERNYNFGGGIAQKKAEILFPLSPTHLLYTCVGNDRDVSDFQRNEWFSRLVWHFILEHSFLHIYSKNRQKGMFQNCPRTVDAKEYSRIQSMLLGWHHDSVEVEEKLF